MIVYGIDDDPYTAGVMAMMRCLGSPRLSKEDPNHPKNWFRPLMIIGVLTMGTVLYLANQAASDEETMEHRFSP